MPATAAMVAMVATEAMKMVSVSLHSDQSLNAPGMSAGGGAGGGSTLEDARLQLDNALHAEKESDAALARSRQAVKKARQHLSNLEKEAAQE